MAGTGDASFTMLVKDDLGAVACQHFSVSFTSVSESMQADNVSKAEMMHSIEAILNESTQFNGGTIAVFGVIQDLKHNAMLSSNETRTLMRDVIASVSQTQNMSGKDASAALRCSRSSASSAP